MESSWDFWKVSGNLLKIFHPFATLVLVRGGSIWLFQNLSRSDTKNSVYLPISSRYQKIRVSADTDIDPIPKILSFRRYRYRSDTKYSVYLPISIRYQKFGVSANTDINPIPTILSICRYRYRSDNKNLEYLPIPISIQYQKFGVFANTDIDLIPKIQCICRYRSDIKNSEYLLIPIRYQKIWVSTDIDPRSFFFYNCWKSIPPCMLTWSWSFCYTQSTKYRQLYCKEKQQMNAYLMIIYEFSG